MSIGTDSGSVQYWDIAKEKNIRTFGGHTSRVGKRECVCVCYVIRIYVFVILIQKFVRILCVCVCMCMCVYVFVCVYQEHYHGVVVYSLQGAG